MPKDAQGLEITGAPASAEAYDRAMADYWGLTGDPVGPLKTAVRDDPAFALGAVATAALFLIGGFRGDHAEVVDALAMARKTIASTTERERKHLAAVEAWAQGRLFEAAQRWEDILVEAPRDALALRLTQDAYFFLGQPFALRDSSARVAPFWDPADPLYGFLLGARAFGLEEAGELEAAEACARDALERNRADAWAAHALAHVLETACRIDEGVAFLKSTRRDWTGAHFMAGHNGWHLALYQIEQGRTDETLADYDRFAAPKLKDDANLDRVDAASLLWRLELEGVDVGRRWEPVAKAWMGHVDDHVLAYNDLHLAFAAARSPDPSDAERLRASLGAYIAQGRGDNRDTTAEIGWPMIDGVLKFAAGDYRGALDAMLPVARRAIRLGGSHAQRDILPLTLIAAAERAGDRQLLRALLAERVAVRPTARVKQALARAM